MEYQSLVGVVPWTFCCGDLQLVYSGFLFKKFCLNRSRAIMDKRAAGG